MALYFAAAAAPAGTGPGLSVYDILNAHYSKVPAGFKVPSLLTPIPDRVAWLRISADTANCFILGTTDNSPFYGPLQKLDSPVEFPGIGGRNIIDLRGIYLQVPAGGANLDVAFLIV